MRKKNLAKVLACGAIAAGLIAALGLSACGGSNTPSSSAGSQTELQVFAANSLSKAMDEAQELYTEQTGVTFADTQYLASGKLNETLAGGAYADVEITASKGTMDTAIEKDFVDESTRTDMFTNELVIVSKIGSGLQDVTLQDIATGQYSICVGDDSVPAGNYAAQALSTVGAYEPPASEAGKTGKEISGKDGSYVGITPILQSSVGNVCKQAENGDVDLAIVYSSDVYRFGGVEIVGIIPDDTHKAIVYPGAVCKDSKNAQAASDFIQWCVTDPDAQKIFQKWGFDLS